MQGDQESVEALQQRLAALEAMLAKSSLRARHDRHRHRPLTVATVLLPILAFSGWAVAQAPVPAPTPGVTPPPGPPARAQDVIKKVGGVTQVTAPFEVVDGSGKVILSVGTEDRSNAGVSIYVGEGAGAVSVHSGTAKTVAALGTDENGNGILRANDAQGTLRAGMSGEGVAGVFDASGEKRVAMLGANEHGAGTLSLSTKSGRLGIEATAGGQREGGIIRAMNANGQTAAGVGVDVQGKGLIAVVDTGGTAQLSISQAGSPSFVILDKSNNQLAAVDSINGKGRVAIFEQGRATAELTAAEAGGGSLVVHSSSGDRIATVGTGANGRGSVTLFQKGIDAAVLSTNDSGAGALSLQNAQGQDGLVAVGAESSFGGSVVVYNNAGEAVAGVGASEDGKGRISIVEKDKQVAVLKAVASGAGTLVLTNAEGKAAIEATGKDEETPGGALTVFNQSGDDVVSLSIDEQNGGVIALRATDDASAELSAGRLDLFDGTEPVLSLESDPGQLQVFNKEGPVVKVGLSGQATGQVVVGTDSKPLASLGVTPGGGGMVVVHSQSSGKAVAGMQTRGDAGYVGVANSNGDTVSEIGVFNGQGQVVVWNPGGKTPAAIMARSSKFDGGTVEVGNQTTTVGVLTVGAMGEGFLQLTDASGTPMVAAGVTKDGRGRVDAGPGNRCAPTHMGLVIPDCILGPAK